MLYTVMYTIDSFINIHYSMALEKEVKCGISIEIHSLAFAFCLQPYHLNRTAEERGRCAGENEREGVWSVLGITIDVPDTCGFPRPGVRCPDMKKCACIIVINNIDSRSYSFVIKTISKETARVFVV